MKGNPELLERKEKGKGKGISNQYSSGTTKRRRGGE